MSVVVRFDQVSKRYHLGVSRTSVVKAISNGVQKVLKPGARKSAENIELWALRDIGFELSRGQSMALIGRNGAGKSTILKLLANITRPTLGQIDTNGRVSALIELGSGFHSDLTGRENIYLNGTILGLKRSEIRRRYDEIVAFSEIERFIETPVKRYSSGMLVRLGFAVASCIEPDILLVDEVLAVGDASFRQKCLSRIRSLSNNGTSIIFVSHNLHMVEATCPTSLYIHKGQIKYRGNTSDAIDAYERDLEEERIRKLTEEDRSENDSVGRDVKITAVETIDMNGEISGDLQSDRPVIIRVRYRAVKPIKNVSAVIRIIRSDNLACCRMRSNIDEVPLALKPGDGAFSISLESLQLMRGTYIVAASIRTEDELVELAQGKSQWFTVVGRQRNDSELAGVFEPRRAWECDSRLAATPIEL